MGLDPERGALRIVVDERGFVTEYELAYEAVTRDGAQVAVFERIEHADVGTSGAARPPWVDTVNGSRTG